jgi:hypothetical protein
VTHTGRLAPVFRFRVDKLPAVPHRHRSWPPREPRSTFPELLPSRAGAVSYRGPVGACSTGMALASSAATSGAGDGRTTGVARAGPGFSTSPGWTFRGPDCSISLLISASGLVAQAASSEQSKRARGVDTRIIL